MDTNPTTILVAGVGNVLLGDDGFGVEVSKRLMQKDNLPSAMKVIETGIGGMSLIQELMYGYEALVIIDAFKRDGKPGQLYMLEPELPDLTTLTPQALRDYFADTHYATPLRALALVEQVGSLPGTIRIVGCEPEGLDECLKAFHHSCPLKKENPPRNPKRENDCHCMRELG